MKKLLMSALMLTALIATTNAAALDPIYTGFFSNDAIKGYDTVAYFTEGKPVAGKPEFSVEFQGANWLFASQENLDLFLSMPGKYAPQYGGYCAYAVSQGQTASIKPELFTIHDGKLYLNYSEAVNQKWTKQKATYIKQADINWVKLMAR